MRFLMLSPVILVALAGVAQAKIPFFNATCGNGVEVHADAGGPVYINGKEAKLKKFNSKAYEASHGHNTIDFSINPDGSVMATWTGKGGANGICQVQGDGDAGVCPPDVSEANRYLYPACN